VACDSLDDIPISASWSICLSGSTAGMAADLGTAATRCRQRVVEPLCRFAGGDLVETTLDQDDGHASLFRSRSPNRRRRTAGPVPMAVSYGQRPCNREGSRT